MKTRHARRMAHALSIATQKMGNMSKDALLMERIEIWFAAMFCHTKRTLDAAKQTSAIVDSYLVRYQRVNWMVFFWRFRRRGGCAELASSITTQNNFWCITILPEKPTPDLMENIRRNRRLQVAHTEALWPLRLKSMPQYLTTVSTAWVKRFQQNLPSS